MLADVHTNGWIETAARRIAAVMACVLVAACGTTGVDTASPSAISSLPAISVQAPVGLPPALTTRLAGQLASELANRSVSVAGSPAAPAQYKLQGFCSAADGGTTTSIACIWDLNTSSGTRANRIVTEETVRGSAPADPWRVVNAATADRIAATVAGNVASWLPTAPRPGSSSLPTLAGLGLTSGPANTVALTGVSGAPGDGNRALARAMTSALRARNIPVTRANPNAYRLNGIVALAPASGGQQELTIEWVLTDSNGGALGTVNQRNQVPSGALDATWGATADSSAGAAADGIVELIPG